MCFCYLVRKNRNGNSLIVKLFTNFSIILGIKNYTNPIYIPDQLFSELSEHVGIFFFFLVRGKFRCIFFLLVEKSLTLFYSLYFLYIYFYLIWIGLASISSVGTYSIQKKIIKRKKEEYKKRKTTTRRRTEREHLAKWSYKWYTRASTYQNWNVNVLLYHFLYHCQVVVCGNLRFQGLDMFPFRHQDRQPFLQIIRSLLEHLVLHNKYGKMRKR